MTLAENSMHGTPLKIKAHAEEDWEQLAPGVNYKQIELENGKMVQTAFHLEVDARNPYIQLSVKSLDHKVGQLATIRELISDEIENDQQVVFGVNGDFFSHIGIPSGIQISNHEVITSKKQSKVVMALMETNDVILREHVKMYASVTTENGHAIDIDEINSSRYLHNDHHLFLYNDRFRTSTKTPQGGIEIGVAVDDERIFPGRTIKGKVLFIEETADTRIENRTIVLSATGSKASWLQKHLKNGDDIAIDVSFSHGIDHAKEVISGNSTYGYPLIRHGKVAEEILDDSNPHNLERHPRTMLASKNGNLHILVIDGRQPGYSDGVTLAEGAYYLKELGMEQAINIDGGGSTTCFIRKPGDEVPEIVNQPSDGFEREVGNAILLTSHAPQKELVQLITEPHKVLKIVAGSTIELSWKGHDKYINPIHVEARDITFKQSGSIGEINQQGIFKASDQEGKGQIILQKDFAKTVIDVEVVSNVDRIDISPQEIVIEPNGQHVFDIIAYDQHDEQIYISKDLLDWTVEGDIGNIGGQGSLQATYGMTSGTITAIYKNLQAKASVKIGQLPEMITDFETLDGMTIETRGVVQDSVSFTRSERPDHVRFGRYAGKITYDFTGQRGRSKVAMKFVDDNERFGRVISGEPYRLGVWVYGDAQNHWLRVGVEDANGETQSLNMTEVGGLNWLNWKYVYAEVPKSFAYPLKVLSLYILETDDANKNSGVLYFDNFRAEYVDLNEDLVGPEISDWFPQSNSALNDGPLEVRATIKDDQSGVNPASIQVTVNEHPVDYEFDEATGHVVAKIDSTILQKRNHVEIEAADYAGNPSIPNASWTFTSEQKEA